jgi:hypothetical protein
MIRNEVLDYCSKTAAILNYQKVRDDLDDEKGFKKLKARLALPLVARARKKAIKKDPELSSLDSAVAQELKILASLEADPASGVDSPADSFGRLLGTIMSFGLDGAEKRITYELGRGVGGWIYVADAIDDVNSDAKKGRYNPLLKLYCGRIPDERELQMISDAIKNRLFDAEGAFDLLPEDRELINNIIANILFLGIPDTTTKIIKSVHSKNDKGKRKEHSND